jgi:hypothetical protein
MSKDKTSKDKTSKDKTSKDKTPKDKTSTHQNVDTSKRRHIKTSTITKRRQLQNFYPLAGYTLAGTRTVITKAVWNTVVIGAGFSSV